MVGTDSDREGRERALTPLLGGVLIVGFVTLSALGVLVVGLEAMAGTQQAAETERTQTSLVELQHTMQTAAEQPENVDTIDLDVGEGGAIIRDDTGSVSIEYANISEELNETITFGAVEYVGDDGTQLAVEAGAVFRGTGASSRLVSGPSISYDNESNTLTLPIIEATGEDQLGSDELLLRSDEIHSQSDVVENDEVIIEIESKYWAGWEEYFVDEVGSRGVVAGPNGDGTGTVRINLGRIDTPTPFENAVTANEEPSANENAGGITGQTEVTTLEPIDDEIDEMVATANGNYTAFGGGSLTAGKYYADDDVSFEDETVDLEDGDVTLVVDGDVSVTDLRVENWDDDSEFQLHTTGDLAVDGQMCVEPCGGNPGNGKGNENDRDHVNAGNVQIYGTSSFQLGLQKGNAYFEGVVYAPAGENGTSKLADQGGQGIDGSLVLGTVDLNGNFEITHDADLKWVDPDIGDAVQPPELTYLNLVYQEIEVNSE